MTNPLTEDHRKVQLRLAAATIEELVTLWDLLDPDDLPGTVPAWLDASTRLVASAHARSAAIARRYYRTLRLEAVGAAAAGTLPIPGFVEEAVRTSLTVTGPVALERARRRGVTTYDASRLAAVNSARAGSRQALLGGRETITHAVRADRRARGWIRVTGGNPCDFCVMQAGRGAVYSAETVDFASHANCACQPEPAF